MLRLISSVMLAVIASNLAAAEQRPTRLYVRTEPAGAVVLLDGKKLGTSDELFVVAPGEHVVRLVLDGYAPEQRRVNVQAERITRLVVSLKKAGSPRTPPSGGAPVEAAESYLRRAKIDENVRMSMLTVLRQHPDETRWSGRKGPTLFAIAAKVLPSGVARKRAIPALMNLTHSLAIQELLKAKSLLDRYAQTGLTDATTLRRAVVKAAGELRVIGHVKGFTHGAAIHSSTAVAYVIAEEPKLTACLLHETELGKVRKAYRDVMHGQARDLMKRGNWKDAVLLWRHLHTRKLVSQALYLDAARCFKQLGQHEDAIRVLDEALKTFRATAMPVFLEQAGDIALSVDTEPGQELAEVAYLEASRKLLNTVSPATQPAEEKVND